MQESRQHIITERMRVHYQNPTASIYSSKNWTRDLARIIFVISAVFLLAEGSAVCPPGRMPPDCQKMCRLGYFGNDCASLCPTTCVNKTCEPDNGFCYRCQLGFTGLNCSRTCHRGFFGQDCNNTCPPGCFRKKCDPFTGLCEKCVPGYEGVRCETHYLMRNHTNETSSSLSHGGTLRGTQQTNTLVNAAMYISAAIVICIMSLSSVALCSYLEKMKARQKNLKTVPIYRKHSMNVLPSSFLRWPGATTTHEYIEMETIDTDYDTTGDADVESNIIVNSLPGRNAMNGGKCSQSTSSNSKHLFALLNLWKTEGKGKRSLPVLAKDRVEFGLNQDGVNTPELSKILKINAPLRVGQAANYSQDLYFKSYLPSQRFLSAVDDTNDRIRGQQELSRPLRSVDPIRSHSLVEEQSNEADIIDLEEIDEGKAQATEPTVDEWYSPRSNSDVFTIGESDITPKETSQKPPVMFNLAHEVLENVKHRTQHMQLSSGSCPRSEESGRTSAIPCKSDRTVVSADVTTQSETNDESTVLSAVTDGHGSRVYAETTEPLMKSGKLLRQVRKSLTFMRRVVKSWTRDIYEPVSEDQRRANLDVVKSELAKIQPELGKQNILGHGEFLCNCLDCELQTEARKFDLEYTCRSFQSQAKKHKDVVNLEVADNAGNSQDNTKYKQKVTCSTVRCRGDDDSGINKYILNILSRQVDYKQTCNDSQCHTNTDVSINDSSYTILPSEHVKRPVSGPVNDVHSVRTDNVYSKNAYDAAQDSGTSTPPANSHNNLSSRRSLVTDATNNFSFCCVNKDRYTESQNIRDQATRQRDIPHVSVSCPELVYMLPELGKNQQIHDPCVESYYKERFRGGGEVGMIHTARSNRRSLSHILSDPSKDSLPRFFGTSYKYATSLNNVSEIATADLDTLSFEAFPHAGVILLSMYEGKVKQGHQTNPIVIAVDEKNILENPDSFTPEINFETYTIESPQENLESGSGTRKTCQTLSQSPQSVDENPQGSNIGRDLGESPEIKFETYTIESPQENLESGSGTRKTCQTLSQSPQSVDENPQGSNVGRDLGEYASLIPKSVIALTVRKHPNREIKPAYISEIKMKRVYEQQQPEEIQRQVKM